MTNWKAYDEVHFSDEYILRWVREGNEYVNRITLDMMEDLQAVVQKQAARIKELEKCLIVEQEHNMMLEEKQSEPYCWVSGGIVYYKESDIPRGKTVISLYTTPQTKPLSDEEIDTIVRDFFGEVDSFYDFRLVIRRCIDRAIEAKVRGEK
jgi:hypothetical protein